jgi:hypothetical protein
MRPDTEPNADGMYWTNGKIYFETPWWVCVVMIPAMIGTWALIAWAVFTLAGMLFL